MYIFIGGSKGKKVDFTTECNWIDPKSGFTMKHFEKKNQDEKSSKLIKEKLKNKVKNSSYTTIFLTYSSFSDKWV